MKLYERFNDGDGNALIKKIAAKIEEGLSVADAARACGVGRTTIYRWIKESEDVAEEIERARSVQQFKLIKVISDAGDTDWRAAAWLLARRFPEEFGKK
jgi:AcrR family transcriptional regulator